MRLTIGNFFSHLLFHPFEADTKKDRVIALSASIACGIFSIGICHAVCALRNCVIHRPSEKATNQDRVISELRNSVLPKHVSNETQPQVEQQNAPINAPQVEFKCASIPTDASPVLVDNPANESKIDTNVTDKNNVKIPAGVQKTLEQLFKDSPFFISIEELPVYPTAIEVGCDPERKNMTAPVMKGILWDGRPFIIIKVDCTLSDEDINNMDLCEEAENFYKTHPKLKDFVLLYQYRIKDPLAWDQLEGAKMRPSFFTGNFTDPRDGTGPTRSQKEHFKLVQQLLKTGESPDTRGLLWRVTPGTWE